MVPLHCEELFRACDSVERSSALARRDAIDRIHDPRIKVDLGFGCSMFASNGPSGRGRFACSLSFIYREAAGKLQRVQILACVKGLSSARVSCGGAKRADDPFLRIAKRAVASRFSLFGPALAADAQ